MVSSYFGEGFDECKKQINLLFLDHDINDLKIDPDLVDKVEHEEEGKDVQS